MIDHASIVQCSRKSNLIGIYINHNLNFASVRNKIIGTKIVLNLIVEMRRRISTTRLGSIL